MEAFKNEINFGPVLIGFLLFIFMMGGCTGCALFGGDKTDTEVIEDVSDNCEHGLKRAEITQDDDDHSVRVECADPPRYGI
jgi:hypothetical protein